ncbi:acyltransferase [Granulosicoccaceae sp. 1_MG-2023]|nr:acyltransferase [Granulosicoccaceae sp. 1_MG-2023]
MQKALLTLWRSAFTLPANNIGVWDGWRGLAIACVLTGHFGQTAMIKEDRLGVDLFFALSGMLMARLLFEKRTDLKTFYVRRFSRIFPALLGFVVFCYAVAVLAGWAFTPLEVVTNLTFLRTYIPADPHIWAGEVPVKNLWSLNVEEHTYVIMSLMALLAMSIKGARLMLLLIGLASVLISLWYNATQVYEDTYFLLRTECAIGFVVISAAYRLHLADNPYTVPGWLVTLAVLLSAACYLVAVPFWVSFVVPPFLLAFAINHLQDCRGLLRWLLSSRPLRYLGLWSYSVYLWQQPLFEYQWAIPGPGWGLPMLLALITGVLSYMLIESPVRTFINERWEQRVLKKSHERRKTRIIPRHTN